MKNSLKPLLIISGIALFTTLAATTFPQQQKQEHKPTNLKVLPKDISHEKLDSIMHSFKTALGVNCGFCHAASKTDPKHLDFASDEKKEKHIARGMMKMTMKINKKYFVKHMGPQGISAVKCATCHRGKKEPEIDFKALEKKG